MSQSGRNTKVVLGLVLTLWLPALGGCSASAPAPESAAMKRTELSFNLDQCQPQGAGLFKCPAIDKPVCSADYAGPAVECVRVGKKGNIYVEELQQE
jgi:hypothetical protein